MSYPQAPASASLLAGADFFRLNQKMTCPGDTYESDVAGLAFAIGPDSDIAQVNINYFDSTSQPTNMSGVIVSNHAPFVGPIYARNDATYQPQGTPGKILFSSQDIVPQLPPYTGIVDGDGTATMVIPPVMDIITYFNDPGSAIVASRNDRTYFMNVQLPAGATRFWLLLPYYGRAYAQIQAFDANGWMGTLAVTGYTYGSNTLANPQTTVLQTPVAVGTGVNKVVRSGTDGYFDYLLLVFTGATGIEVPLHVRFSDTPQ